MRAARLGLALALVLAAESASAATAAPPEPPAEPPVAVEPGAPRGSSGDMATGAAIGLVGGFLVLMLIVGSAD